jgi:hypothetical protein
MLNIRVMNNKYRTFIDVNTGEIFLISKDDENIKDYENTEKFLEYFEYGVCDTNGN